MGLKSETGKPKSRRETHGGFARATCHADAHTGGGGFDVLRVYNSSFVLRGRLRERT